MISIDYFQANKIKRKIRAGYVGGAAIKSTHDSWGFYFDASPKSMITAKATFNLFGIEYTQVETTLYIPKFVSDVQYQIITDIIES